MGKTWFSLLLTFRGLTNFVETLESNIARFLFQEHFEFIPQLKLWMATHHKPKVSGDDPAIWRRIHLIPFKVVISALSVPRLCQCQSPEMTPAHTPPKGGRGASRAFFRGTEIISEKCLTKLSIMKRWRADRIKTRIIISLSLIHI